MRELCKLIRESDIRTRLGRLPKGLTGVYDEIIHSIKSQPNCNFDIAIRALQWVLVSTRPLKPGELAMAAELNPSTAGDHFALDLLQEPASALEVDLLIHACGGLLPLDTILDVIRFSYHSVQEYLETRSEIWDIDVVDAQLFVSESCLWVLHYGHSLSLPLYEYAALNWYKHCRSYQDLVLATNIKHTKHKLSIPLLNRFLGSFKQASTSYIEWANWVDKYDSNPLHCIRSTPLCPAFSTAFASLWELVAWLWDFGGGSIEVRNDGDDSLLHVSRRHGSAWIIAKI